jgi:site-specific recombinase, phage integrase family
LETDGILTGAGNKKWYTSTVKKILANEKYIGDALLQKTCTIDILNKTRVANNGIAPQYYVEDDHEAIIPKEIYMKVQEELVRRRNVQASPRGKKRMYSCTHCFSQMVVCGNCGEVFRRIYWNNHGCRSIVWRCASRLEQNGAVCNARTVNEKELEQVVLKALNEMLGAKSTYKEQLQKNLMQVQRNDTSVQKDRIAERLLVLQQELLNRANNREAYDDVAEEIFHLRELQQQADFDETTKAIQMERIKELQDFIGQQGSELNEFDEKLVKRWLRQITVWDDHYTVELKSGLSIDVPA